MKETDAITDWEQQYITILSEGVQVALAAELAERDDLEKRISENAEALRDAKTLLETEERLKNEALSAYEGKDLSGHAEKVGLAEIKVSLLRARVERLRAEGTRLERELNELRQRISLKGRSALRQAHHDQQVAINEVEAGLASRHGAWGRALELVERSHRLGVDPYPTMILHLSMNETLRKYA